MFKKPLAPLLLGLSVAGWPSAGARAQERMAGRAGRKEPEVYKPGEVTRRAVVKSKPPPKYTDEARKADYEGEVVLRLVLASTGKVTNVQPLNELPYGLTKEAIKAARKIKFAPATKDGKPVSTWVTVTYVFRNLWR